MNWDDPKINSIDDAIEWYEAEIDISDPLMSEETRIFHETECPNCNAARFALYALKGINDLKSNGFCRSCIGCNAPHDADKITWCEDWEWKGII